MSSHSLRAGSLVWVGYRGQKRQRTGSRFFVAFDPDTQTSEPARRLCRTHFHMKGFALADSF